MVRPPVRSIIHSLKLVDYLSVQTWCRSDLFLLKRSGYRIFFFPSVQLGENLEIISNLSYITLIITHQIVTARDVIS